MRKVLVIGIGAGNPDYMTVQAINALNAADVFFVLDKGEAAEELIAIREEICRRFITRANYRIVKVPQPERDRASADYKAGVDAWHADKAALFETLIRDELGEGECGAFLVWGDPALYDSTIRILHQILARGQTAFRLRGHSRASAARRLWRPGTRSRSTALASRSSSPQDARSRPASIDSVVLLDAGSGLRALRDQDATIYWGAYLGTPDEVLISGKVTDVLDEILRVRDQLRQKGWIMDTYLLRRDERIKGVPRLEARLPQHGQRFHRRAAETRHRQIGRELRGEGQIERRRPGIEQCPRGSFRLGPVCCGCWNNGRRRFDLRCGGFDNRQDRRVRTGHDDRLHCRTAGWQRWRDDCRFDDLRLGSRAGDLNAFRRRCRSGLLAEEPRE